MSRLLQWNQIGMDTTELYTVQKFEAGKIFFVFFERSLIEEMIIQKSL